MSLQTLMDHSHPAWQRLKAEELLAQQLSQLQSRRARAHLRTGPGNGVSTGVCFQRRAGAAGDAALYTELLAKLPFGLTRAQQRVCAEIAQDLAWPVPMHRLLQGMWVLARPWWLRWRRRSASMRAGNAP